ncbi:MAG: MFS transporter [Bacteroidota bacterium]
MNKFGISRNTFVLGWVSFFNDIASEIIYPLLPLFLSSVLGADKALIGLIEGIAESTASLLKLVSGWLADRTGRNKLLATLGYGASAIGRPLYALVTASWQVLGLRFLDRVGKGLRTAPRDVMIAESTAPEAMGRAFGFHRSLDTLGAVVGPGLAIWLMAIFHQHFQSVFLAATIPGFIALFLLFFVRDAHRSEARPLHPLRWGAFGSSFRLFIVASFVFALGNSSNAFLILRTQNLGVGVGLVPVVYLLYNFVYSLTAFPAGILADRLGRGRVLLSGYLVFALIYLGFALANQPWQAWVLFAGYGLYSGITDGIGRAWIKEISPDTLRGSAFGIYDFAVGLAALPASLLAGAIWDHWGASTTFLVDAGLALAAIALFLMSIKRHRGEA